MDRKPIVIKDLIYILLVTILFSIVITMTSKYVNQYAFINSSEAQTICEEDSGTMLMEAKLSKESREDNASLFLMNRKDVPWKLIKTAKNSEESADGIMLSYNLAAVLNAKLGDDISLADERGREIGTYTVEALFIPAVSDFNENEVLETGVAVVNFLPKEYCNGECISLCSEDNIGNKSVIMVKKDRMKYFLEKIVGEIWRFELAVVTLLYCVYFFMLCEDGRQFIRLHQNDYITYRLLGLRKRVISCQYIRCISKNALEKSTAAMVLSLLISRLFFKVYLGIGYMTLLIVLMVIINMIAVPVLRYFIHRVERSMQWQI